jgi:hypothetical protein
MITRTSPLLDFKQLLRLLPRIVEWRRGEFSTRAGEDLAEVGSMHACLAHSLPLTDFDMLLEPPTSPADFVAHDSGQTARTEDERNTIAVFSKANRCRSHQSARASRQSSNPSALRAREALSHHHGHFTNYHVIESANRIEVYLPDGVMAVAHWSARHACGGVAGRLVLPSAHEPLPRGFETSHRPESYRRAIRSLLAVTGVL